MTKPLNTLEQLAAVTDWISNQDERLALGLRSAFDGLRLYEYWLNEPTVPEYCDQDEEEKDIDLSIHRIKALGYDPLSTEFTQDAPIGTLPVLSLLNEAYMLVDSVAYVRTEGDTDEIVPAMLHILGIENV